MRIRACIALFVAALAAVSGSAADPKGIEGIWEGPLKGGVIELRLAFKVAKDKDGKLTATMDSIDQGAKDIPCGGVAFEKKRLEIGIPLLKAKYAATLTDDGMLLKGEYEQNGSKHKLDLKRVEKVSTLNRPQHPKAPFPYASEEVTFENAAAKIKFSGTLTLPKGNGPFPAVVLVSGSGPQDRDETILWHKPFLVIADFFARRGIAVLRFDDRGVGKSEGKHDGATSADFATDAYSAVLFLKGRKEIDPKRIGVMGHSEGGLIAPMVAADHPADVGFIVLLAGPGVPGDEVLQRQQSEILKAMGEKPEAIKLSAKMMAAIMPIAKQTGPADERKAKLTKAIDLFAEGLTDDERKVVGESGDKAAAESIAARLSDGWMQFFLAFDPRPTLAKVKCPVLAVNGELDLQVLHDQNVPAIEAAVKKGGNDKVTTKVFPGLNHLFQSTKTGSPSEYGQIEETFSPEVLEFVAKWILR